MSRKGLTGLLFVAPSLALVFLFYIVPISWSARMSLYEAGRFDHAWVGMRNYIELVEGGDFLASIRTSLKFLIGYLFGSLVVAYAIALCLDKLEPRFAAALRSVYFVPKVLTGVATVSVWRWFFRLDGGAFNQVLGKLRIPPIPWLGDPRIAPWSLSIILFGGVLALAVLLYSAALGQIDRSLIDAARIDGANELQVVWHIITPLTQRTRLYIILTNLIASVQLWEHPYFFTSGGPLGSTSTITVEVFHTAFNMRKIGLASAMTLSTTIGIVAITWMFMARLRVRI